MQGTVYETLSMSKGQGHKVMGRSSTKTSNASSKRHSVVEIYLSYRTDVFPLPSELRGQIFVRKFLNSRFCTFAVKIFPKLTYRVVKSPLF